MAVERRLKLSDQISKAHALYNCEILWSFSRLIFYTLIVIVCFDDSLIAGTNP